jgi:hypothetical protein
MQQVKYPVRENQSFALRAQATAIPIADCPIAILMSVSWDQLEIGNWQLAIG